MYTGQCLCGGVKYKIEGEFPEKDGQLPLPTYCHCKMCQRLSGSAFTVGSMVLNSQFSFLQGEDLIKPYESSPGVYRSFCSECGSSLLFQSDHEPGITYVNIGAIDEPLNIKTRSHIFVADKASWYDINDELPQFDAYPED